MSAYDLSAKVVEAIAAMGDGEESSLARVAYKVWGEGWEKETLFLEELIIYMCAKRGILLDFGVHDENEIIGSFNQPFVVKRTKLAAAPAGNLYACVLHHPLIGCWIRPDMDPEDYPVVRAVVYFNGLLSDAKKLYYKDDCGSRFSIDCVQINANVYALALRSGMQGVPYEIYLAKSGESIETRVPLCDAMESWTFVVSKTPIDIASVTEGFRQVSKNEYVCIKNELDRDEYFRRLSERESRPKRLRTSIAEFIQAKLNAHKK